MDSSLANFSARAAARFSSLGGESSGPTLTCTPSKPGRDTIHGGGCSSDDEEEVGACAARPEPSLMPWRLVCRGEVDGEGRALAEPSAASRRAFEDEAEEDEFDVMATGSMSSMCEQEEMPARGTEVLLDNAWDRKTCGPVELHAAADPKPGKVQHTQLKRPVSHFPSKTGVLSIPRVPGDRRGRNVRQSSKRRSYVPDHVRHPEKYICYTLDEPLIVGSGRDGTHGGGPQQPQKEFESTPQMIDIQDQEEPERFVTQFGSGIEYRPSVAKENPAQKREPSSANKSKVSISAFEENGSYVDEISQSGQLNKVTVKDDQGSSVEFRQRTQNRRQYRSVRK